MLTYDIELCKKIIELFMSESEHKTLLIGGNKNHIKIVDEGIYYKEHNITQKLACFINNGNLDILLPSPSETKQ